MNPEEMTLAYYGVRSGEGFSHLPRLPLWLTFQQIKPLSNCRPSDNRWIPWHRIQSAYGILRMALRRDAELVLII